MRSGSLRIGLAVVFIGGYALGYPPLCATRLDEIENLRSCLKAGSLVAYLASDEARLTSGNVLRLR